jgi:hypothetical protein
MLFNRAGMLETVSVRSENLTRSITDMPQLQSTRRRCQLRTAILASSKKAGSRAKVHETGNDFATDVAG